MIRLVERVLVRVTRSGHIGEAVFNSRHALAFRDVVHVDRVLVRERVQAQGVLRKD